MGMGARLAAASVALALAACPRAGLARPCQPSPGAAPLSGELGELSIEALLEVPVSVARTLSVLGSVWMARARR